MQLHPLYVRARALFVCLFVCVSVLLLFFIYIFIQYFVVVIVIIIIADKQDQKCRDCSNQT